MQFERLDPKRHNRRRFDCGEEALNRYIQTLANQDQKRSLTKVTVLAKEDRIIGYYSLSAHSVDRANLPDDVPLGGYNDVPFLLLGRLAVDKDYQRKGYGDAMIFHAFSTTLEAAENVGILGVLVDAKDEKAVSFYEGFGFRRIHGSKNRLMLPLSAIAKLIREQGSSKRL